MGQSLASEIPIENGRLIGLMNQVVLNSIPRPFFVTLYSVMHS